MKNIILVIVFALIAPLNLLLCFFSLAQINKPKTFSSQPMLVKSVGPTQLFAALPQKTGEVLGEITYEDARPIIIEKYLAKHKSPLLPYSNVLLEKADQYGIDYRLIVAIAQCESNLCKHYKEGTFNCWGFENGDTQFSSWEHALERVAKTLRVGYYDKGLTTPDLIMPKYAPPSVAKGGPWAKCVNQFIDVLEYGKVD